ncbi:flavodoxin domain-containing protein [Pseudooceanicola sp. CBS1P-1]|uniref:Flavodoxin n=1 Tax=Pseudooceanicola albus TaxID=2692189 RepID=A0A6L7G5D8_9RHOB|nr:MULTISPECIES: hypothetical protein [Pseudooceanicola]MBT9383053.1 flavodoxin domain-containing protein [Pseudooceanicola endophyticus]MXN19241.1 hypothetical protein [Pseudooceanicola albus]
MTCRILIYSLHGNTLKVGEALAWELGAQLHEIATAPPEPGLWSMLRQGVGSLLSKSAAEIDVPDQPWEHSDLLILGGSVADGHLARPLRQWLETRPPLPGRVAFFVTSPDGALPEAALREMSRLTGHEPVAVLHVTDSMMARDDWSDEMTRFLEACVVRYRKTA